MKNMMKTFWIIVAAIGLFVAICTADNSRHELALRLVGIVMLAAGGWFGGLMDIGKGEEE